MIRRVIVCGGRDYNDHARMAEVLYKVCEVRGRSDVVVVHGGAKGADSHADEICGNWGLRTEEHEAEWDRYGSPAAAHIRNQAMVDAGADLCLAFPGGAGTADCVRRARKAGIPVREVGEREPLMEHGYTQTELAELQGEYR